jgi:hypothetical protein
LLLEVTAPVDWLPEVALEPDHAPEAVQEVALVEDQVTVEDPPLVTEEGFAATDTVTVGLPVDTASPAPPPQAANARANTRTISKVFVRNLGILIYFSLDRYSNDFSVVSKS